MSNPNSLKPEVANAITRVLLDLVSHIPSSTEPTSSAPLKKAQSIARSSAVKAAGISGAMALPSGPLALATIIPDLAAIWRLQQSMVADIASVFGKSAFLTKETMTICLFKHGSAALVRDLVVRVGERVLIRRPALKIIQQILKAVGVRITQKVIGKSMTRVIPIVGALGVGAYAYYDTTQVAANAIELFSKNLLLADSEASVQ